MAGETEMGGFFWRLGVKSTVREDIAGAKSEINGLEVAGQKTAASIDILDQATGKNIRGLRSFGSVASMTGGSLMMLSMSMKDADGNTSELGKVIQAAGMTLTTFGMVTNMLPPIIRAIGFAHTAIIPAINAATAAKISSISADQALVAAQTELTAVKVASAGITGVLENAEAEASAATLLNATAAQVEVNTIREQTIAKMAVTGATIAASAATAASIPVTTAAAGEAAIMAGAMATLSPTITGAAMAAIAETAAVSALTEAEIAAIAATATYSFATGESTLLLGADTAGKVVATGVTFTLAGATYTLAGAMTVLAAATVIGAVIVGAYLLYTAWDKAQQGARDLEKQLKSLSDEMSILGQVQKTQSYETGIFEEKLKGMNDKADEAADKVKSLTEELDKYKDAVKDASGLALDIKSAELDLKKYPAEMRAANKAIAEAKTADERSLAKIARDELQVTHQRELDNLSDLKSKELAGKDVIKAVDAQGGKAAVEQKKTDALAEQKKINDDIIIQEGEIRKLKLEELATNQQLAVLSFQEYFLKMDQAGKSLTQEQYDIFTKDPSSPAAKAMVIVPPYTKRAYTLEEQVAMAPPGGYYAGPNTGTFKSNLFKDVMQGQQLPGMGTNYKPDVYIPITVGTNTTPGRYVIKLSNEQKAALYGV
jgi:hypothetical protein